LADRNVDEVEQVLAFGPFELVPSRKLLLRDGVIVRLGSRAIELLMALVERSGEVVGKNELIAHVWPDTVVEDNNLRVHITALRKALGAGQPGARYIINVTGRGYSFIEPVTHGTGSAPMAGVEPARLGNLPISISRPVGRSLAVDSIAHLLIGHRLVTIVGPGGIGKSTVALEVAEQISERFPAGACFADLSGVAEADSIPVALASAVGASILSEDPVSSLVAYLRNLKMLILVDNCEHLIEEATEVILRVLRSTSEVTVLATSREPLQAEGEQIYQLSALGSPPADSPQSAAEALRYPAVQLFAERAMNGSDSFMVTDENAGAIGNICRRLDGVPLAIEIVAARAGLVGLAALELGEDDSALLTATGRRTASARHRSLRATLDWSYAQLSQVEQLALQRLSIFKSWFGVPAAVAVVKDASMHERDALEAVMALIGKSLLATDISDQDFRYRLLHVTRVYAAELLTASGEVSATRRRHAEYLQMFLEDATRNNATLSRTRWQMLHQSSIEDLRAAMDWALQSDSDRKLGARLALAGVTFGFQLSLIDEFRRWTERALAVVKGLPEPDPALELRLAVALSTLRNRMADSDGSADTDIDRMIALTREVGTPQNLIWPLANRALMTLDFGDYATATQTLTELEATARLDDDAFAALTADRVGAMVCHWAGDHRRGRQLAERVLRHPARAIPPVYSPISVDRRVSMRVVLARILWLEGFADQSRELAAEALALASADSPNAVCDVLGHAACPIAFWRGDPLEARRLTDMLLENSRRYALTRWSIAASCFEATLAAEQSAMPPLPGLQRDLMATISDRWLDAATIARGQQQLAGWCTPEIQRRVAEAQMRSQAGSIASASALLNASVQLARAQGSLAWELRSATTLADMWLAEGRRREGAALLEPILSRFSEGLATADVLRARALIQQLNA
jgi:predicted ATPase/DNA-binding winged helix-turn-helix (wHTH) protein